MTVLASADNMTGPPPSTGHYTGAARRYKVKTLIKRLILKQTIFEGIH
jgi:hypothetical protein